MKIANLLFIITLLISCSYQEELKEHVQENSQMEMESHAQVENKMLSESESHAEEEAHAETETETEAEIESSAQLQLGSTEQTEVEVHELSEEELSMMETFGQDYFDGNWLMYGYGCNRNTPKVEKCKCHRENNQFICIKTLGDDCVTTGHETFRGNLPNPIVDNKNYSITYVVGNARRPNSGHWRNSLHIVNINEYRSQGRKYIRDTAQNEKEKPKPKPAPVTPEPVPQPAPVPRPVPVQRLVYYYYNYFLGNWNGVGYICDDKTPQIEVVNIRYSKGRLYAMKLLGDNCVPAQKLSFEGVIPGKLWQGLRFPVQFVIGSPKYPASRQVPNNIEIIDLNTFRIGNHTFYRVMGPGSASPHGVYINMTPMVGNSLYPGPGYVKVNPKRNMRSPVRRFVIVEEETNKPGNC